MGADDRGSGTTSVEQAEIGVRPTDFAGRKSAFGQGAAGLVSGEGLGVLPGEAAVVDVDGGGYRAAVLAEVGQDPAGLCRPGPYWCAWWVASRNRTEVRFWCE